MKRIGPIASVSAALLGCLLVACTNHAQSAKRTPDASVTTPKQTVTLDNEGISKMLTRSDGMPSEFKLHWSPKPTGDQRRDNKLVQSTITGVVVNQHGTPIPGALIELEEAPNQFAPYTTALATPKRAADAQVRADAQGRFSLPTGATRSCTLTASLDGMLGSSVISVPARDTVTIVLRGPFLSAR